MKRKTILVVLVSLFFVGSLIACSGRAASKAQTIPAKEMIRKDGVKEWDLLWVSDSTGWGVAKVYAEYLSQDLGIKVNVMDKWMGGLPVGLVLKALKTKDTNSYTLDHLEEYIKEAEIIVFHGNPLHSVSKDHAGDWNCGQKDIVGCYVNSCGMETFNVYIQHIKEVFGNIYKLRAGKPTMLRAYDAYNPIMMRLCTPAEVLADCRICSENLNNAIRQAAEEMKVPLGKVFDAWNGINHNEDPIAKGYTKDDYHPNELGAKVIAGVLRELGYEMVIP